MLISLYSYMYVSCCHAHTVKLLITTYTYSHLMFYSVLSNAFIARSKEH